MNGKSTCFKFSMQQNTIPQSILLKMEIQQSEKISFIPDSDFTNLAGAFYRPCVLSLKSFALARPQSPILEAEGSQ